jgi:hypothetical protein
MSSFRDNLRKRAEKTWKDNRKAEAGSGGGITLELGTYNGVQSWEESAVKSGETKGAPVLIETLTVDTGPDEGQSVSKRYTFSSNTFKDRNGVERTQADTAFEALAKRLKQSHPDKAAEINEMAADALADFVCDELLTSEHRVKFLIDEFDTVRDGKKSKQKYFTVIRPIEDEYSEDEEYDDEPEDATPVEDDDEPETDDESDDEDGILFEEGDVVMWQSPVGKKPAEFTVDAIAKNGDLTLKSARGKKFPKISPDDVDLIE